jgi:hypothetical protein
MQPDHCSIAYTSFSLQRANFLNSVRCGSNLEQRNAEQGLFKTLAKATNVAASATVLSRGEFSSPTLAIPATQGGKAHVDAR